MTSQQPGALKLVRNNGMSGPTQMASFSRLDTQVKIKVRNAEMSCQIATINIPRWVRPSKVYVWETLGEPS